MKTWKSMAVALLLTAAAACAAAPRTRPLPIGDIETGPGTVQGARKFLEGRWALESFEIRSADGKQVPLKGSGVLDYDDFGNLRMEIRADQASSDVLRAASHNKLELKQKTQPTTANVKKNKNQS